MKICWLGDVHVGVRNNSTNFHKHSEKFFSKVFFPYLKEHNISTIIQLGDLFDSRKAINLLSLYEAKRVIFDPMKANGMTFYTLLGNHDIYYRESLQVNSTALLLNEYSNVYIFDQPKAVQFAGLNIDFIPWVCNDNKEEVASFVSNSKSDYCVGHFGFTGFQMYKGVDAHDGYPVEMYSKYKLVVSGHYHTKSVKGNILYTGTPYDTTWSDFNDPKGFWIFDTDTGETEFIQNPYTIFEKLEYDDTSTDYSKFDVSTLTDKYVKLVIVNKNDLFGYDNFLKRLYSAGCYDIKIIEDMSEFSNGNIDEKIDLADTKQILSDYIDNVDTDMDKESVKNLMSSLFLEAVNVSLT
jgi:DNA repair exonuclease SbcCD nuclease subunit